MDTKDYLLQTSQHIHQDIMFADQKAGVFIVANMGILGALYTTNYLWPPKGNWGLDILTLLTVTVLVVAIGYFGFVLYPRGVKYHSDLPKGHCDLSSPQKIALLPPAEFTARFCTPEDPAALESTILRDLTVMVHTRSRVNQAKYVILRRGILATFAGWTLAFFLVATPLYRYLRADQPSSQQAVTPVKTPP